MSFPISFVGNEFEGEGCKWKGGVSTEDGFIYAAPCNAKQILKINAANHKTELVGDPLEQGFPEEWRYTGCFWDSNDYIYFVPGKASKVIRFHVKNITWENFGEVPIGTERPECIDKVKWNGGAMGNDGCFYCAPFSRQEILKINPDGPLELIKMPPTSSLFGGAVASKDESSIFFIPLDGQEILRFNIGQKNLFEHIRIGHLTENNSRCFAEGLLGPDGCIYCLPLKAPKILKIDPEKAMDQSENPSLVDIDLGHGNDRTESYHEWANGVLARNGCIYGAPARANNILQWNVQNGAVEHIGLECQDKGWSCAVLDEISGDIFAIPADHPRVLRIIPSLFTFGANAIADSAKGTDRLGHELYAKAIAKHILSAEKRNEAVSVGLFSPWGSGKTFFWTLIQQQFEEQQDKKSKEKTTRLQSVLESVRDFISMCKRKSILVHSISFILEFICMLFFNIFTALLFCYYWGKWDLPDESKNSKGIKHRIQVVFNGWTYNGTDEVWASMLDQLWKAVLAVLDEDDIKWHRVGIALAEADIKASDGPKEILDKQMMARRKFQIGANAQIGIFSWISSLLFANLFWAIYHYAIVTAEIDSTNRNRFDDDALRGGIERTWYETSTYIVLATLALLTSIATLLFRWYKIKDNLKDGIDNIMNKIKTYKKKDFTADLGYKGEVREEVKYLFQFLDLHNARIVLFVDDLDRCDCETAMDVIWALSSLLFGSTDKDAPITSFLAVDTEILVDYIEAHFRNQSNMNGFRFLDKIVNLPFSIPPIDIEGKKTFCKRSIYHNELDIHRVFQKYREVMNLNYEFDLKDGTKSMLESLKGMAKVLRIKFDEDQFLYRPSEQEKVFTEMLEKFDGLGGGLDGKVDDSSSTSDGLNRDTFIGNNFSRDQEFIKDYAHFLDGVPRKIKRILNVYGVSRYIAMDSYKDPTKTMVSIEKLFLFVVLQELCPYRTSWLVYISHCAENGVGNVTEKDDENMSFCSLLKDLRDEHRPKGEDPAPIQKIELGKLDLNTVYTRIVCGVLHCFPSAEKHLRADLGLMYYDVLLNKLKLRDLYSDHLQTYVFNLPRNMIDEIKMYRNHCVIYRRDIHINHGQVKSWVTGFRKMTTLSKSQPWTSMKKKNVNKGNNKNTENSNNMDENEGDNGSESNLSLNYGNGRVVDVLQLESET